MTFNFAGWEWGIRRYEEKMFYTKKPRETFYKLLLSVKKSPPCQIKSHFGCTRMTCVGYCRSNPCFIWNKKKVKIFSVSLKLNPRCVCVWGGGEENPLII